MRVRRPRRAAISSGSSCRRLCASESRVRPSSASGSSSCPPRPLVGARGSARQRARAGRERAAKGARGGCESCGSCLREGDELEARGLHAAGEARVRHAPEVGQHRRPPLARHLRWWHGQLRLRPPAAITRPRPAGRRAAGGRGRVSAGEATEGGGEEASLGVEFEGAKRVDAPELGRQTLERVALE